MYGYSERELQYSRAGDGVLGLLLAATAAGRRAHGPQEGEEGAGVHGLFVWPCGWKMRQR